MPLKAFLRELTEGIPGAQGAILADWEGEMVDQVSKMDDFELKILGAHKGIILNQLREALEGDEETDVQEIIITTDKLQTLLMPINKDYFLLFAMQRGEEVLGRARFMAERCVRRLRKEIE
ncbi:MAG: GTPase-activating protein [Desulfuromonas sp.]|nr:MAG: GTPase-activating protein [Desulfuromonas sp.]